MAGENKYGKTSLSTKDIGGITRPMAGEDSSTPTVMSMKETGKTTKPTVKASTTTTTDPATTVNGTKMYNKASASKNGPMDHRMKGTFFSNL